MVQLVGILNLTPDSFSDGGLFIEPAAAMARVEKLFKDGASIVDVGAESTRPNATALSWQEEWERLEPVLPELMKAYPRILSLDTYHPETAAKALEHGDIIINDVTGMNNLKMVELVIKHQARCVIGHMLGEDAQASHRGELVNDVKQVTDDLLVVAEFLQTKGLPMENIILDPGIGFGKTQELNVQLLKFAEQVPDYEVMIGYSRKRFLGDKRMELETNLAAGRTAIDSGAAYLRVHDVLGHSQLL